MAVLLVACVFAFNSVAFDFWMCAHPNNHAELPYWQHRFYVWFAVTLVLGAGWLFLLILLLARRRSRIDGV